MAPTPLPDPDYISKLLVPEEMTQICLGGYEFITNFSGGLSIIISSKVEVTSGSEFKVVLSDNLDETKHLVSFIGKSIQSHRIEGDAIVLIFSDNSSWKILRNDYYESFSISKGKEAFYV